MRGKLTLPTIPEPFPKEFRSLLTALLATRGNIHSGRVEQLRARRSVLSQSGTFVGHRRYERGDDLRHLDWSAYARTGELFTKQLQEDDRRAVTVVIDLSPSMLAGTPPRRLAALRLAAVLAGLALARVDGVSIVAPGASNANARFTGTAQLPQLLDHLKQLPTVFVPPLTAVALAMQAESVGRVHWISDFAPVQDFSRPLLSLRRRGANVAGWIPTVPEDEAAPAGGYLRIVDPETRAELSVPVDRALHDELRRQLVLLERQQRRMFAEAGSPLWRWDQGSAEHPRLADYLPIVAACTR
ncbi:MAG: hypothetical protein ACI8UD_001245 [Planctomycetota bacterium]|jgi:uncharacterized protein (DUF58 family)